MAGFEKELEFRFQFMTLTDHHSDFVKHLIELSKNTEVRYTQGGAKAGVQF